MTKHNFADTQISYELSLYRTFGEGDRRRYDALIAALQGADPAVCFVADVGARASEALYGVLKSYVGAFESRGFNALMVTQLGSPVVPETALYLLDEIRKRRNSDDGLRYLFCAALVENGNPNYRKAYAALLAEEGERKELMPLARWLKGTGDKTEKP